MNYIKKYIQQVVTELKKVTWPNKQQTINKTVLVIIVSAAVALYIGALDYLLQQIMQILLS